jgi:hypothetical protein
MVVIRHGMLEEPSFPISVNAWITSKLPRSPVVFSRHESKLQRVLHNRLRKLPVRIRGNRGVTKRMTAKVKMKSVIFSVPFHLPKAFPKSLIFCSLANIVIQVMWFSPRCFTK